MEELGTKYGIFVRMLMLNVNKGKPTRKADVREELKIDNQTMEKLIIYSKEKVNLLGFKLIGVDKNNIVDPLKAEKYYLNKSIEEEAVEITDNFKKMIVILCFISLENDKLSLKRLIFMVEKVNLFKKEDVEGFVRFLKKEGYLEIVKEETESYVELGWRFNAEYGEGDIIGLARELMGN